MAISTVTLNIGLTTSKNHFVESMRGLPIFTTDAAAVGLAEWIQLSLMEGIGIGKFKYRVDISGAERTLIVEYNTSALLHRITFETQSIADMLFQECVAQRVTTHQGVVEKLVGTIESEWGTFNKESFKELVNVQS